MAGSVIVRLLVVVVVGQAACGAAATREADAELVVVAELPGASATEVVTGLVKPLEAALRHLPGLQRMYAVATGGRKSECTCRWQPRRLPTSARR